ncbi:hypothetical protein GBF38_000023 [Nibea albiflora]|nr:hypothetical protein GBF38_000023 [Nibea albiflora]
MIARDPEKVTGHLRLIKFVSPPPQFFRDGRTLSVDLEAVTSRSNKLRLTENILNLGLIARDPEKVTGHLRLIKFVSPPPQFFRDGRTLSVDLETVTSRSNKLRLTENILNSG